MDIYLTVLIGLLGLCVGAIIGLGIDFKIFCYERFTH